MCNANIFRTLNADEIEVRVQQVTKGDIKKAILLLYKNARADMDLLDEHFGALGWQREHNFKDGKNYCKISVYDTDKQMWISKEDVGVESNTEETKGEASDSFKRAAVTLGIGRELYSAPSILVELENNEWYQNERTGNPTIYAWVKFRVLDIDYDERRRISNLVILDANGNIRYNLRGNRKDDRPKKKLTVDDLLDNDTSQKICEWIKKNYNGEKIADVIKKSYDCDMEVIDCITKEYLRLYA